MFLAFLIVCIIAVNAAQSNQNHANKRNQLAKKKATNGAVAVKSNHVLKAKPRARGSAKKVRKVKPSIARKPKKSVVRRVVKKSNRRPANKKVARKSNKSSRNTLRRGSSRGGSRKRLAKQELSDSSENKSIGAGQANGDLDSSAGDKPADTSSQSAPKPAPAQPAAAPAQPAAAPAQPAAAQPAAAPAAAPASSPDNTNLLSSPAQGGLSSPFNIPKAQAGQNQAIGAAFSQSSNGGNYGSGLAEHTLSIWSVQNDF